MYVSTQGKSIRLISPPTNPSAVHRANHTTALWDRSLSLLSALSPPVESRCWSTVGSLCLLIRRGWLIQYWVLRITFLHFPCHSGYCQSHAPRQCDSELSIVCKQHCLIGSAFICSELWQNWLVCLAFCMLSFRWDLLRVVHFKEQALKEMDVITNCALLPTNSGCTWQKGLSQLQEQTSAVEDCPHCCVCWQDACDEGIGSVRHWFCFEIPQI